MAADYPPLQRRLATWMVTGPVGHGFAAAIDVAAFATWMARRRLSRSGEGE